MPLLSFSLYGADRLYCHGAIRNVELAAEIYPGWDVRFAVDDSVPVAVLDCLRALGADVVPMRKRLGSEYGKFWRFLVAADPSVDRFVVRDADSRVNVREKAAVDAWIASGKPFHLMRDSMHHDRRMMGGLWGGVGGAIPDIEARIDAWGRFERWGDSDSFLSEEIWPLVRDRALCHDSVGHFDDGEPFPPHPPLAGTCYVGEIVPVDRPPLDVWREVGVLRDQIVALHAELARREAANVAAQAEIAHQVEARQGLEAEIQRGEARLREKARLRDEPRRGQETAGAASIPRALLRRVLAQIERRTRSL